MCILFMKNNIKIMGTAHSAETLYELKNIKISILALFKQ
jgi:hypothetical protein